MDARNWGIWFTAVHSSAGLTRPIRPVQASAAVGPLKKPTRSTLALKKDTNAKKPKIQVKSTFVKLKNRICYTCRAKGYMSKDCSNGKVLNSKLVQYDFARLGRDKNEYLCQ